MFAIAFRNGFIALGILLLTNSVVQASERYLLNAGDVLDISVWNEEALQKQLIVLPDGMISFPLAGELQAQGQSVSDLQAALKNNLADYLADPYVTVSVANVSGNTVHIMGKVLKPGNFMMSKPTDVMQALSMAGGLSPYAEENNIIILRRSGESQQVLAVHYASIKKGRELDTNILLQSGDVIVIP
jgi:polysaccharide export outer membrane protein